MRELKLLSDGGGDSEHAHYCLVVLLDEHIADSRFEIIQAMKGAGVGVSVYYPGPVPNLKYYKEKYDLDVANYPNAARISNQSIALSVGPHLNEEDMLFTAKVLKSAICGVKA